MAMVRKWNRLLAHGYFRQKCVASTNDPSRPTRRYADDSKVIHSPFSDVQIPSSLINECIWGNLEKWPDKDALVCGITGRKYTFYQTKLASKRFGASLSKRGATPGQVIAVMLPNLPEFAIASLGAIEAGLVVTTINPIYTPNEIAHQLKDSGVSGIVTIPELLKKVIEAQKLVNESVKKQMFIVTVNLNGSKPDNTWDFNEMLDPSIDTSILKQTRSNGDVVFMPYSSGTTGLSKGVALSHRNIVANFSQVNHPEISHIHKTTENHQDIMVGVLPFYHIYGLTMILLRGLNKGCKLVSLPKLETDSFLNVLKNHKATLLYAVPPIVLLLGQHKNVEPEHLESLRIICNGAGPVKETDAQRLLDRSKNKNLRFCQAYGMTECSPAIFISRNSTSDNYLTVGPPIPNTSAKVVDLSDPSKTLGVGEAGEILIKGPQVMIGYHNNPEATAKTIDSDGWLSTGDIGYYDENRNFYIVDRIKELIKVQGYQVPPAELEGLLRTHPSIEEAAVVGVPNDRTGEAPLAFVVVNKDRPTVSGEEIQEFVAERVAPYKRITAGVVFMDQLPKSAAGKILRRFLKDEYMKNAQSK